MKLDFAIEELVSPRFHADKLQSGNLNDKIDVFEDRLNGWLIAPMELMAHQARPTFGVPLMTFALTYFENIGQYIRGCPSNGQSKASFLEGIRHVLYGGQQITGSLAEKECDAYYRLGRCGAFHDGLLKEGFKVLSVDGQTSTINSDATAFVIAVNPWWLFSKIKTHATKYIADLRSGQGVSEFVRYFDQIATHPIITMRPK